jgi:tRNA 2-thiouridine synthesizing protein A
LGLNRSGFGFDAGVIQGAAISTPTSAITLAFARMTLTKLDLTGLKCPLPVLRTRKALKALAPGDRLEVHCTDPLAAIDIPHLIAQTGDRVAATQRQEATTIFMIEKIGTAASGDCD